MQALHELTRLSRSHVAKRTRTSKIWRTYFDHQSSGARGIRALTTGKEAESLKIIPQWGGHP